MAGRKTRAPRTKADADEKKRFQKIFFWIGMLAIVALVVVMVFSRIFPDNALLSKPESALSTVVTPVQSAFSGAVDSVVAYLRTLKLRANIESEYNRLKQENEQLVYEAMLAEELRKQLSVYENMSEEISANNAMNPIICSVIGRESGNYFSVFTINKGTRDGIADYMAVTIDGALVGYVEKASLTQSTVRTIIDSEASIAALIQSSRDQGTVRGTLGIDGEPMCRMYYLASDILPRPGDIVVTSGVGMSFPKGIPIGTVRESTRGMEANKQFIVLEPDVDFEHIEYVIVLRYQPDAIAVTAQNGEAGSVSAFAAIPTARPVPTVLIGGDGYWLTATPTPSPLPGEATPTPTAATPTPTSAPTPAASGGDVLEYVPVNERGTDNSFDFTVAPTATPSPTPPPLIPTVEEDEEG